MTLTRFAPAPTGALHLGHVASALEVFRLARAHGAEVLLRIEDHDAQRSRPGFEAALLDDLDWLGFTFDRYPTSAFRAGRCDSRQSGRHAIYAAEAASLAAAGLLYGCRCSRRDVDAAGPPAGSGVSRTERPYPGTCRDLGLPLDDRHGWRLRLEPGEERFDDLLAGPQQQRPDRQCGDVLIRDRLGNWTYQFVASVDDFRQGIDLVVRGTDLLASTGRQIRMARLLGRQAPARFAHHGLIMKSATQKLSKSDGDTGVGDLRAQGWTPADVTREARRLLAASCRC